MTGDISSALKRSARHQQVVAVGSAVPFRFNNYPPRGALDCEVATPQLKRAENPELAVARSLGVL